MAELQEAVEQSSEGLETATNDGLESNTEQSVATQTTDQGSETLIYDPEMIRGKPELEALAKQLQGSYTRKTQELAGQRQKIEAYDSFVNDPLAAMRNFAQQYGYSLIQGQPEQQQQGEFQPQTWDEVLGEATNRAKSELLKELSPLIGRVEKLQQQNIESYLDTHHSDWRSYEDRMTDIVKQHPTMARDPDLLYEMAIPKDIRQSRATQAALAKIKTDSGAAQVSGGSSTSKQVSDRPNKPLSFREAYEYAKKKIGSA